MTQPSRPPWMRSASLDRVAPTAIDWPRATRARKPSTSAFAFVFRDGAAVLRERSDLDRDSEAGRHSPPERQFGQRALLVHAERAVAGDDRRRAEDRPLPACAVARPRALRHHHRGEAEGEDEARRAA